MKTVVISGLPRSGTSWTGKALSFTPKFTYYREPDNSEFVEDAPGPNYWNLYLRGDDDHPIYGPHMERALRGDIANAFTLYDDCGPILGLMPERWRSVGDRFPILYLRRPNVIVKLVRSSLALAWIAEHFPSTPIVSLVRHPVGQFESYRKLGWQADPQVLLRDERLIADHLAPFVDLMRSARGFWEQAGAFWGAVNFVVYRQAQASGCHSVVPFEWLCADGPAHMKMLAHRLGLDWTAKSRRFVSAGHGAAQGNPYSLRRDTHAQIDKWRQTVAPADVEACRAFVEPFALPVYDGFDPWAAQPRWSERMPPGPRSDHATG